MNYLAYWFLSLMPCCLEKKMLIDGKEEVCLVLPVKQNQIKKGKQGNWMMMCRLAELPPNAKNQTHDIQLTYLAEDDLQRSYDLGYHSRTAHMGRVYEHDRTPEKKLDRTNLAADLICDGPIVLSDIPRELIFANAENAKRYITGLEFRHVSDLSVIYTGTICLDDIPKQDILVNQDNGKKYVNARFVKLQQLDTYMNTHQLIIRRPDGTEIEIGRFREWASSRPVTAPAPPRRNEEEVHETTVNPRIPDEIGGIRF